MKLRTTHACIGLFALASSSFTAPAPAKAVTVDWATQYLPGGLLYNDLGTSANFASTDGTVKGQISSTQDMLALVQGQNLGGNFTPGMAGIFTQGT